MSNRREISFLSSMNFLIRHIRLVAWSVLLVAATWALTWFWYVEAVSLINGLTQHFFQAVPNSSGIWGWIIHKAWAIMQFFFVLVTRLTSFYLAFLISYCLTSPGYVFLSGSVEKIYMKNNRKENSLNRGRFSLAMAINDLWEGIKIGLLGVLVTIIAIAVNFIPVIGQILVFLIYVFYSALMFIDYPASNRHWSLKRKIKWVFTHYTHSFRIGVMPALVSMIPIINIMFMALLFPLFTIHTTLTFISTEEGEPI